MNQNSNTCDDFTDYTVQRIVEEQGNCTDVNICIACPFFKECCASIKITARFLDRQARLRKAEDYLFTKLLESEIEQDIE
jgi:hypothetical protein